MPFTFSHPALALPVYFFRRKYFSITGLIMGSIAPDFEYFLRMKKGPSVYSHSLGAIFWFNLPAALILAFIFHYIIKKPLNHNLPNFLSGRFMNYENLQWLNFLERNWLKVIVSIVIGTGSHLLWDWFTHYSVLLTNSNWKIDLFFFNRYFSIYLYTLLHIINSLVGLVLIVIGIWRLPFNHDCIKAQREKWYWFKILLTSMVIVTFYSIINAIQFIEDLLTIAISAFLIALSLFSLLNNIRFQNL